MSQNKATSLLYCIVLCLLGWLYSQCFDTQVVGFIQDDGIYALLGKSLATGHGFHLSHLVSHPPQIKYPILYPLLLSLGWWLNPVFPNNLPLLNFITLGFSIGAFTLLYFYLQQCHKLSAWLAGWITLLVATNFYYFYYATALMSEAPYLFFSILTLWRAEVRLKKNTTLQDLGLLIFLSALTFHTRIIGITLIMAISLSLLIQKEWKTAWIYTLGTLSLTLLPWGIWVSLSQNSLTDSNMIGTLPYTHYVNEWLTTIHSTPFLSAMRHNIGGFIEGLGDTLIPLLANAPKWVQPQDILQHPLEGLSVLSTHLLFGYLLYLGIKSLLSFKKQKPLCSELYTFLYCGAILLWNVEGQLTRFMALITPWLWIYLFKPLLTQPQQKKGIATLCILLLGSFAFIEAPFNYQNLRFNRSHHFWIQMMASPQYIGLWQDYQETFAYIEKKIPHLIPLACEMNATVALYTHHETFPLRTALIERGHLGFNEAAFPILMKSMLQQHVGYLMVEPEFGDKQKILSPENLVASYLLYQYPQYFQPIYLSPRGFIKIYRIKSP